MTSFEELLKEGVVKKVTVNKARAKSFASESARKMHSLNLQMEKIGMTEHNANDYVEYCYNIILYLLRALLYLEGYSASGHGAYEAEISYLKLLGFSET